MVVLTSWAHQKVVVGWSCHRGGHINGVTLLENVLTFCRAVKKWPHYRGGRITQVVV